MRNATLILFLSIALILIFAPVTLAQDAPPTPPPDLTPTIDDLSAGLKDFWTSAAVLMGFVVFLVSQGLKYIIPDRVIDTRSIYMTVLLIFAVLYTIAQLMNAGAFLGRAIELGTVIANTLLAILGMLVVPSVAYKVGKKLDNPIMGGKQGSEWLSFKDTKRDLIPARAASEQMPGDYIRPDYN